MGKNDNKKKVDVQLQRAQTQANDERDTWNARQNTERDDAYGRQTAMFDSQFGALDKLANQGALSPEQEANFRGLIGSGGGGGGGGGGGYGSGDFMPDLSALNEVEGLYRDSITGKSINQDNLRKGMPTLEELMKSGGYSPEQLAGVGQDIGTLRSIAASGGVDPTGQARMRGMGVFDEYAQTGGLSNQDRSVIRAKGNSTIPAFYDNMRREAGRQARVTGTNAGQSALMAKLGREQALGAQTAAINTEMGLVDSINKGRQYGATNVAQSEAALQNLMSQNRLRGAEGAIAGQRGVGEFMANTRGSSAKEVGDVESGIQDKLTAERQYGMGGLEQIIQQRIQEERNARASAAAANAASEAQASADWRDRMGLEQYMLETDLAGQQFGLEGMGNLYRSVPGEVNARDQNILAGMGLSGQGDVARTGLQLQRGENTSGIDTALKIAGTAAGVAGAFTPQRAAQQIIPNQQGYNPTAQIPARWSYNV
jgi:hypothetical protein